MSKDKNNRPKSDEQLDKERANRINKKKRTLDRKNKRQLKKAGLLL